MTGKRARPDRRTVLGSVLAVGPALAAMPAEADTAQLRAALRASGDRLAIEELQYAFGYHLDGGEWDEAAALFAPDGTLESDGEGAHLGPDRIARFLSQRGPAGGAPGRLWISMQMQPVVDIASDGRSALARFRTLEMRGEFQVNARWGEGVYEISYVRAGGVWRFSRMRFRRTFLADYRGGWATGRLPPDGQ